MLPASFELSLLIAKENKSCIIGEALVKLCLLKANDIILETDSRQKLSRTPISENTVKRHIDDIAEDIINQVVDSIKQSPFYSI